MMDVLPTMPTTWSVCTSCLASAAICAGLVCSVSILYTIGWPLMPPLAFTQAKYAAAMFAMSVNDVPGWLVTMPPSTIGVPVAATPGLVPHVEVSTVPAAAVDVAVGVPLLVGLVVLLVVLLLLLLHPAAAMATATASTIALRAFNVLIRSHPFWR